MQPPTFFERLAETIGPTPAMTLCAFASARPTLYIPDNYTAGHILERLLGENAFLSLVANFGGETFTPPAMMLQPVRALGKVYALTRAGLTAQQIADPTGLGYRNIKHLQKRLASNEPLI